MALPQKIIPTRCGDPGAVATGCGNPAIAPRRPGRDDRGFGQPVQQLAIRFGIGRWISELLERRHMPRPTDHRDALEPFGLGLAQTLPHKRFAQCLAIG